MRYSQIVNEDAGRTVTLWHGGRDLQYSYGEFRSHKSGTWEHGPGLYLTTHMETAARYAKGGGSLYKVTVTLGTPLRDIKVTEEQAAKFIQTFIASNKRKDIKNDVERGFARFKDGSLPLENLMNLGINYEAIRPGMTGELRQYMAEMGADYTVVNRYGGRDETVLVVINPKIIKKVVPVKSKDVTSDEYQLTF
jgi:hypothetical protein